jgi:AraC-like DNA-binding protein
MLQEQEQRRVYYDRDLQIEAYNLSGVVQTFPNHFHEYYVIAYMEGGRRHLCCKGKEYKLSAGDLVLFNPRDNHYCTPIDGSILDYRALNLSPESMARAAREVTGKDYIPYFTHNVVYQSEITKSICDVYELIVHNAPKLEKEEAFFFLLQQVFQEYSAPFAEVDILEPDPQLKTLCSYMEEHYEDNITLEELLAMTNYSKSYLLRSFTKQIGVSPYRYLQNVRLTKAKDLLEQGIAPIDAASMAGFSDQSHFTNFFKEFIGLTPKQYQRIFTTTAEPKTMEKE